MMLRQPTDVPSALLADLVAIDSVNPVYGGPGETGVAAFVADWLARRSIPFEWQDAPRGGRNIVARVGPPSADALLLEAHMDTVGVAGWAEGDPFKLERRAGRWYGRGACDTKGSLASFMLVLARCHAEPERLRRPLVFAASIDEENEQRGAYALAGELRRLGVGAALTGEPTRCDVVARHKGVCRYEIVCGGLAAHGSTPELGDNAIYKAARIVSAAQALSLRLASQETSDPMERGSLNVGSIRGGSGFNVVPDACALEIDRRLSALETPEGARAELEEILAREDGARLVAALERPALRGSGSKNFVEALLEAARAAGVDARRRDAAYMTNAVAYEAAGVPAAVFGPGDIAQAHKADEFIEEGEIERSCAVLLRFLQR